jgi:D-arabinitol 4-dehydrogenase
MNHSNTSHVRASTYVIADCDIGIVHLGYGAFHRAHQAAYIDEYMEKTGDLRWGIAAVNLRAAEALEFARNNVNDDGFILKSISPTGEVNLSRVRSHVGFFDWSKSTTQAEQLVSSPNVKLVTITVTESGYYTDPNGMLDLTDPTIKSEIQGGENTSVYAFLANALHARQQTINQPITICCCDNIRSNGKMLKRNLSAYLVATERDDLNAWVADNVKFPCSMVDRITPRATPELAQELSLVTGGNVKNPIIAESFIQWVLEDDFAAQMPNLSDVGVTVTPDVDPYEETKIRVLNGGHTCLAYLAALRGVDTFDQAMSEPDLLDHFRKYETNEVLPAITTQVPFSKEGYLDDIEKRFLNSAIADTVSRICADGFAKFQIFIRPTLEGCLAQGIMPHYGITSIASWYVFSKHAQAGKVNFQYLEPNWESLQALLGSDEFITSKQLWGDLPTQYPAFADALRVAIKKMEQSWPV